MQLQEYSCVGILRQYNKYSTGETFCIELLSVVIVRKYHGSSTVPSLSCGPRSLKLRENAKKTPKNAKNALLLKIFLLVGI